jgi:hypothetical protein
MPSDPRSVRGGRERRAERLYEIDQIGLPHLRVEMGEVPVRLTGRPYVAAPEACLAATARPRDREPDDPRAAVRDKVRVPAANISLGNGRKVCCVTNVDKMAIM